MLALCALIAFPALMAFAAASDLVTMTIPNLLALALVALFGVLAVGGGMPLPTIGLHAALGIGTLAVCFGMFACGWIGGGDAKLAAATALFLGLGGLLDYLLLAGLCGGALTFAVILLRRFPLPGLGLRMPWLARLQDPKSGVPYGIALAAAALVVYPHTEIWARAIGG